jgi:putative ABC transport system permease protein
MFPPAILKLLVSQLAVRKVRTLLTALAIGLSVSLVVAVTSGYTSVEAAGKRYLDRYLGSTDATISGPLRARTGVPASLTAALQADPRVRLATPRLELDLFLTEPNGRPIDNRPAQVIGLLRPYDTRVDNLRLEAGMWFDTETDPTAKVAVIDHVAAERLQATVGTVISINSPRGRVPVTVVGIVRKPDILARGNQSLYLPLPMMQQQFLDAAAGADRLTRLSIDLQPNTDFVAWQADWTSKLETLDPSLRLSMSSASRGKLQQNLLGLNLLSYLGSAGAMLAATFIIFATLSMGLAERQRIMAMTRAIGATKSQLAALVISEGLALSVLGLILGLPLGYLWLQILYLNFKVVFQAGIVLNGLGVAFAIATAVVSSVLASLLPAYHATKVSPLEAMNPFSKSTTPAAVLGWAAIGAACIAFDLLLVHATWVAVFTPLGFADPLDAARSFSFWTHFTIGLPILMLGLFLVSPLVVRIIENLTAPAIAFVCRVPRTLLIHQLSGHTWRTAGTASALMVGYSLLVVMQTQGTSALNSWQIPDKFPDIFIVAPVTGPLNEAQIERLKAVDGIAPGKLMPVAVASPNFGSGMFALAGAALLPDATMFFGIDPDIAFDLMDLNFTEGTTAQAQAMLKKGRHIIVTKEFQQLRGLKVGDSIPLKTTRSGTVDYTIAGIVHSPGLDVINGLFDLSSQFEQRTAMSMFGTLDDAKKDFGISEVYLFAANLLPGTDRDVLLANVQKQVGQLGMRSGDIRQIKQRIQSEFSDLLLMISTLAIAAMAVAALGVTNTIMASVRARQWEIGVLRAIGSSRGQMARLLVAEATTIGLCGLAMGVLCGGVMVFNARAMSTLIVGFNPPLTIPWTILTAGAAAMLILTILAAAQPAYALGKRQVLDLLQSGRAAT